MAFPSVSRATLIKAGVAIGLTAAAFVAKQRYTENHASLTRNYDIHFSTPEGWKEIPHGPQALFVYEEPGTGFRLHGSVNQMVSEINPTADVDSDRLAQNVVLNTRTNMPEWTAELLDSIDTDTARFSLVRRERNAKKTVVTAFAVKGNTTLLVSLTSENKRPEEVTAKLDTLRNYVRGIRLEPLPTDPDIVAITEPTETITR